MAQQQPATTRCAVSLALVTFTLAAYLSAHPGAAAAHFSAPATARAPRAAVGSASPPWRSEIPPLTGLPRQPLPATPAPTAPAAPPPSPAPSAAGWAAALLAGPLAALAALAAVWRRRADRPLLEPLALGVGPAPAGLSRRAALGSVAAGAVTAGAALAPPAEAAAPDTKTVSAFLPPFGAEGLYLFVPSPRETPSIRAGTIDPTDPYTFAIPGEWRRQTVSNAISGNYCQPKCGEPWTEVIFSGPEGRCQIVAGPLDKLTPKAGASLTDIGPPEQVINSVGSYMTGSSIDEESVVASEAKTVNGRVYYTYELDADYGTLPRHCLSSVTTKGDVILIFTVNATDKQWSSAKNLLRAVRESFQADAVGRK